MGKNSVQQKVKALLLFSGGLDSMIAAKILERAGLKVTLLSFESYFFDSAQARQSATQLDLPLLIKKFGPSHLGVVQQPVHGYGKAMNPCIDCHGLMLKEAKKIAAEKNITVLATGDVLRQRPFSQNIKAFKKIETATALERKILRPLSAQLLPETIYEKAGLVNRKKMLAISGRSRKIQMALTDEFGIQEFPSPAGGCLLTEKAFGIKLAKLFQAVEKPLPSDLELIKFGRHCWEKSAHLVLGRNKEENFQLENLASPKDILIKRQDELGPTALIRPQRKLTLSEKNSLLEKSQRLIWQHSRKKAGGKKWDELEYTIIKH